MSPVAIAIERAVKSSKDWATVEANFEKEVKALEFSPDAQYTIYTVPLQSALLWKDGKISDLKLLLSINGEIGAIWWFGLPRIDEFYRGLEMVREYYQRGATSLIAYTQNSVVKAHLERAGATHRNGRFYVNPECLQRKLKNLSR